MFLEVAEKKFPLRHAPKSGHFVIVKADHEGRYYVEFLTEIRERPKLLDSLDYPPDAEQARDFPEHGQTIDVEANSRMTQ